MYEPTAWETEVVADTATHPHLFSVRRTLGKAIKDPQTITAYKLDKVRS